MLQHDQAGEGLPVVLIHGFPLCRKMWQPQIDVLVKAGYQVICPDLPGFGDSPALDGPASMSRYADAVLALMDDLDIDQAVIGGMSMGGYVLFNLLDRCPERLSAAMFLVTRAAADDAAGRQKRTALAVEVEAGNRLIVPETFAGVLFAEQTPVDNPELVTRVRGWMESTSPEGVVGGLLAMRDRPDAVAQLSQFRLPCLVVGADQDIAVPLEHSRVLADGLPDAELKVIAGAGHMANLEQPERFNRVLLDFLEKL